MSRKPVYTILTTDPVLTGLGMTSGSVFGSAVAESPDIRPFAVAKWSEERPFIGSLGTQEFEFWVYDEPGSYARINKILERVKLLLTELHADVVVDAQRFSTAVWRGTSPDLYDDIYKCVTRYATFTIV